MDGKIKKQNPQGGFPGGCFGKVGRGFGTQTWALHPVVRGSIPRRSTIIFNNNTLFGELQ